MLGFTVVAIRVAQEKTPKRRKERSTSQRSVPAEQALDTRPDDEESIEPSALILVGTGELT